MSSLIVPVASLQNVRKHPNADKLILADVLGWQVALPADACWKEGDKVVYFPPDTCLPLELSDRLGITKYLKGGNRVGKIALRGEPSFGFAVPFPVGEKWEMGDNVAEFFKCTKYVPPIRPSSGDMETPDPLFGEFTEIENMRNFPDVFKDGEDVIVTEKVDGTNSRFGLVDGVWMAGSHKTRRKRPSDMDMASNVYWFPSVLPGVPKLISSAAIKYSAEAVILYGEVYGGSIQSLSYGIPSGKGFGYKAFGLSVDGRYLDYDIFKLLCDENGVETVPLIYRGPFSLAKMKTLSDGNSTMPGAMHIREGVVVLPVNERRDPKIGRVCLKYVGDTYLLGKHTDYAEI